jgi:hypothetical protein
MVVWTSRFIVTVTVREIESICQISFYRLCKFEEHVGAGNISSSIAVALERAKVLYHRMEHQSLHAVSDGSIGSHESH